jgi:hypothetical protein
MRVAGNLPLALSGGQSTERKCRVQLRHQRGSVGVVGRQRTIEEEVLVTGVDEQLASLRPNRPDQLSCSVDVALVREELVVGLAVNLNRGRATGRRRIHR